MIGSNEDKIITTARYTPLGAMQWTDTKHNDVIVKKAIATSKAKSPEAEKVWEQHTLGPTDIAIPDVFGWLDDAKKILIIGGIALIGVYFITRRK